HRLLSREHVEHTAHGSQRNHHNRHGLDRALAWELRGRRWGWTRGCWFATPPLELSPPARSAALVLLGALQNMHLGQVLAQAPRVFEVLVAKRNPAGQKLAPARRKRRPRRTLCLLSYVDVERHDKSIDVANLFSHARSRHDVRKPPIPHHGFASERT